MVPQVVNKAGSTSTVPAVPMSLSTEVVTDLTIPHKVVAQSADGSVQVLAPENLKVVEFKVDVIKVDCPSCLYDIKHYVFHKVVDKKTVVMKLFGCPNIECENHGLDFSPLPESIILVATKTE